MLCPSPPPALLALRPFAIGGVVVDPPLTLAPMAGQTTYAFRALCRQLGGCGLVCTELISSTALQRKGARERTFQRFDWRAGESPVAVQLFGSDPRVMAEAARIVADHGADIVDINMGCWVPKVARRGGGAALLNDLPSAAAVVEAVARAVSLPVTVKVRAGWRSGQPTAIAFARAAEELGAQAVAVHGRYADQGFNGQADWEVIGQVKQAVRRIPVIGNGDVASAADVRRMVAQTGCDGVMIGRAALGRPWIFRQIAHELAAGAPLPAPSVQERAAAALWQAQLTLETTRLEPIVAIRELRGQLIKYCDGVPNAAAVRERIVQAESLDDIAAALAPLLV